MNTMGDVRERGSVDGLVADNLFIVPAWGEEICRRYTVVAEAIAGEFGISIEELSSIPANRTLGPRGQAAFDAMETK
ncbi:hypothetical protein A2118_01605 [Candidatus Kaiserbacteria bacterium GWA2_50_9]|uniref:Uncharacterized protein n=1 Tax=Candidatus Kaiserbacteria bacterium GWA2_50_9 TaxID=1798474 RepID=A0A1F6BV71_9BACT|nr:MAG: hypothetical protein A2118_01605 [Candidatus Kaiserbacteria bacterium GWA2_50_9]